MTEIKRLDSDDFRLIVKSNKLVESKQNLSLIQQRIVTLLASMINKDDEDFKTYNFHISEIVNGKVSGNHYSIMKKELNGILDVKIEIETGEKGSMNFKKYNLFGHAGYDEKSKVAEISFSEQMRPYLLKFSDHYTSYLDQYTKYYLTNVINFSKIHSLRIYELCKQYLTIGERKISIDMLKFYLAIEDKYVGRFDLFEKKVLVPAKSEINEFSDIIIDYDKIKTGRKITDVFFKIEKNKDIKLEKERLDDGIVYSKEKTVNSKPNTGSDDGLEEAFFIKLEKKYDRSYIDFVIKEVKKLDNIKSLKNFIIYALSKEKYLQDYNSKKQKIVTTEQLNKTKEKEKWQSNELPKIFDEERKKTLTKYFKNHNEVVLANYIFEFEDSSKTDHKKIIKKIMDNENLSSIQRNKVISWFILENETDEKLIMFAKSDVRTFAKNKFNHEWID